MSHNNGKIAAPVSIYDVQQVLGVSGGDLAAICVANSINKWARYKPERADGPMPLICGISLDDLRSRKANNFGLDVPYCTQAIMNKKVFNLINYNETGWDYLEPRGDLSQTTAHVKEFYRLTDFAHLPSSFDPNDNNTLTGYNHNAVIPFETNLTATIYTFRISLIYLKLYHQTTRHGDQLFKSLGHTMTKIAGIGYIGKIMTNHSWRLQVRL